VAGRTILIVDDDVDTRIILRALLERNRYEVVEATTAEDAVARARQHALELVILNYPMADSNGNSLAKLLRSLEPTRAVPLLNITSRFIPQFIQQAAVDGVDVTLPKPIDIANIIQIVAELTARSPVTSR
jgi:CheY-like chemotaxis protein